MTCAQACGGIFMIDGWFRKVWCTVHDAQPWVGGPGYYKEAEEASESWGTSQLSSIENKSMAYYISSFLQVLTPFPEGRDYEVEMK